MVVNRDNIQGDTFSRGFPKVSETYYFFSILKNKEKDFSKALKKLATDGHISSLNQVIADWVKIDKAKEDDKKNKAIDPSSKETIVPVSHALIAFSKLGLERVSTSISMAAYLRNAKQSRLKLP